ncbi:MAG: hypothetical protein ABIO44_01150 [Saprospiraceae bacterium]
MRFTLVKIFLSFILLSLTFVNSNAQASTDFIEVKSLFDSTEPVWINFYNGYDNFGNKYLLILGNNQETEKGFLHFINKKTKLFLEGPYNLIQSKLLAMDTLSNVWGNLTGERQDSMFSANLISSDKKLAYDLRFKQINRNIIEPAECPYNISYHIYKNDSTKNLLNFQLFEDGIVHGYYFSNDDKINYYLSGRCLDLSCRSIQLSGTSPISWKKEKFKIQILNDHEIILSSTNHKFKKTFIKENKLEFICKSYFTNRHSIQARYLNLDNRNYQKWIQNFTQNWINSCINRNQSPIDSNTNMKLNFDLAWCNHQYISGIFFWNEQGYRLNINYPLNYNLKSGEVIQLIDLFEKNTDYKSVIKNYIDSSKQVLSVNFTKNNKEFIQKDPFNYWTILPTGLCFTSELNSIYGAYRILVPYARLDALLRKNSFVKKLI